MQDRVPLYPGRVTLTPVQGLANTYTMARADQPTQEGTPLNKASLLRDETAVAYGPEVETPDDALNALKTNHRTWAVGDTITTMRTDLGDKWLLCNGDVIESQDYPQLTQVSKKTTFSSPIAGLEELYGLNGVYSGGGYFVAYGITEDKKPVIAYTSHMSTVSGWTTKHISWPEEPEFASGGITDVCFANGLWVVTGTVNTQYEEGYVYISYATSLDGEWTTEEVHTDSDDPRVGLARVFYGHGYWTVFFQKALSTSDHMYGYYSSSITGPWTEIQNVPDYEYVQFVNGYWIAVNYDNCKYTASVVAPTWTNWDIFSSNYSSGNSIQNVDFVDGKWVFWCNRELTESGARYNDGLICYANSLGATPTIVELFHIQNANANARYGAGASGYYWMIGRADQSSPYVLYWADNINGPYKTLDLPTDISHINSSTFLNGVWLIEGDEKAAYLSLPPDTLPVLPNISLDAYTYIRAKE